MAKAVIPPQVEIAALKKKVVQQSNLMKGGSGTPWEDRGSLGVLKAFFLTCFRSIGSPGKLWDELSRPETTRDATAFAMGCGFFVGISWVVHSLWWDLFHSGLKNDQSVPPMLVRDNPNFDVNWQMWSLASILQLACAVFGIVLFLRLANSIYQKLIPHKQAFRIPPSLTYNLLAYSLGPVLFTWIPLYGWILSLVWFLFLLIYVGSRRLSLSAGEGLIAGILTMIVITAVGFGSYFVGDFAWGRVTGSSVTYTPPLPPPGSPGSTG